MKRAEKEQVVAELVERLRTAPALIVADYRGLTMPQLEGVRSELVKHGARFMVVKNTLGRLAAEAAGLEGLSELLQGPTAIAFVSAEEHTVEVAKVLSEAARKTRILAVRGGLFEGRQLAPDQVRELATLPPADVLRGQVVGALVGPLNAIVGLFAAPLRDLVAVVDARIGQRQGKEA